MGSQAIDSSAVETTTRKLRNFLDEMVGQAGEDEARPAICQRIRDTRDHLFKQWKADHPRQRPNPFSQEEVARRVGVSLGGYGAWERTLEPDLQRLREIAVALELDEDYFAPTGNLATATARLEAEADRFAGLGDRLEDVLAGLEALVPGAPHDRIPVGRAVEPPQPEQDPPQR